MTSMYGNQGMQGPTGTSQGNKMAGYEVGQNPNFTPEMMQLFQQMFSHVSPDSQTAKLAMGDEAAFNQMEAPAMRQFGQLQSQLASRFSGFGEGALSARNGSGFKNASNQATSDFAQDLQSKRQDIMRQARQDLFSMSNDLLSKEPNFLTDEETPPWMKFLMAILPTAGAAGGAYLGGPAGAAQGYSAGNAATAGLKAGMK